MGHRDFQVGVRCRGNTEWPSDTLKVKQVHLAFFNEEMKEKYESGCGEWHEKCSQDRG